MIHFAPHDGIYLLYRNYKDESVVLILNKNKKETTLDLERFDNKLQGKALRNVMNQTKIVWKDTLQLNQSGAYLFSTMKNN